MRLLPKTSVGRIALLIALAMFTSQALTFIFLARYFYAPTIKEHTALVAAVADINFGITKNADFQAINKRLVKASGIEVLHQPLTITKHTYLFFTEPLVKYYAGLVSESIGEPIQLNFQYRNEPVMWITAKSFNGSWLKVPLRFFRHYDRYLFFAVLIGIPLLAFFASLLIIRQLNLPLKKLGQEAGKIGRGEYQLTLEESTGPEEIRVLNHAFNQMANELLRAQKDRALLLAGVSHDLRTPLTRMRLSAEFLTDPELSEGIVRDIEDMDAILDQFIAFIRDGSDEVAEYSSLNELISDVVSYFDPGDFKLQLNEIPPLTFKRLAIKRLLNNLITNAKRYGKPPFEIFTEFAGNEVVLSIADHGKGVNEQDIPLLLQPFSQGNKARTHQGSGLGLAIVQRIASMHHGRTELSNRKEGGLEVKIFLPVTGRLLEPESLSTTVR